jgi:hypothetical protein
MKSNIKKVYVPVSVENELPEKMKRVFTIDNFNHISVHQRVTEEEYKHDLNTFKECHDKNGFLNFGDENVFVEFWLKEQELIIFTNDEYNEHLNNMMDSTVEEISKSTCINMLGRNWISYTFEAGIRFLDKVLISLDKDSIKNALKKTFDKFK